MRQSEGRTLSRPECLVGRDGGGRVQQPLEPREGARDTQRVSVTTNRPDWRVGVLVGGSWQQPMLAIPSAGPLVLGVAAERRIVGGVWVGLWTLPQYGAGGASVTLEF